MYPDDQEEVRRLRDIVNAILLVHIRLTESVSQMKIMHIVEPAKPVGRELAPEPAKPVAKEVAPETVEAEEDRVVQLDVPPVED